MTQEQRPLLTLAPKPDSIRQRADGRCVSYKSISDRYQRPGAPFTLTSNEAPSKVDPLQVVFLSIHVAVTY